MSLPNYDYGLRETYHATAATPQFVDVPSTSSSYNAILSLVERGIVFGYADGTFKPNETVSRGQFASMLSRALKLPKANSSFKDVPKNSSLYEGISRAANAGLIMGNKGKFYPNQGVSNADIATILDRAMNLKGNFNETVALWYTDSSSITGYSLNSVKKMTRYQIMSGNTNHKFEPGKFANRAQTSIYIYRTLNLIEGNSIPPKPKPPIIKKQVRVDDKDQALLLNQSERSEKDLILALKNAILKLKNSQQNTVDDYKAYLDISITLAVIDRKVDYIGWTNVNELATVLNTSTSLIGKPITIPESYQNAIYEAESRLRTIKIAEGNIMRMKNKVTKLKKSIPSAKIADTIQVLYGSNSYNTMNQKEYDVVLEIVSDTLSRMDKVVFGGRDSQFYYRYLNGERYTEKTDQLKYMGFTNAEREIGSLVKAGISKEEIITLYKLKELAWELETRVPSQNISSSKYSYGYNFGDFYVTKSPSNYEISISAYDALVRLLDDREAIAQVYSAVFDAKGYRTDTKNGYMYFEMKGQWWNSSLLPVDKNGNLVR
jgi:hypothetical protein